MSEFTVGQELDWLHGHNHHRIATVIEVTENKVKLSGLTKDYWMKKTTLKRNIEKSYPVGQAIPGA